MRVFSIASRTLIHDKRRYIMLFVAASIGISLTISVCGILNGMMASLYEKARIYYGGDAMLLNRYLAFSDSESFFKKLRPYFDEKGYFISGRYDYENDSYMIFEGTSVNQRKLKGVDFSIEENLFNNLNFVAGSADGMKNSNGIIISGQHAERLCANVGDSLVLMIKTQNNYTNTATVIIKGILKANSLFAQGISYLDIDFLRSVTGTPLDTITTINIFSKHSAVSDNAGLRHSELVRIHRDLSQILNMANLTDNKKEFLYDPNGFRSPKEASKICLVSLDANLDDVAFLIDAMHIIIFIIMGVLIVIIAIGIGSTYKVIAVKRINEIGIYMALGMNKAQITALFLLEAFLLFSGSFLFSLVFSIGIVLLLRVLDFSMIPNFDIFLTNSHIIINISVWQTALIFLTVCIVTLALVFITVRKNVNIQPVDALSVSE